MDIPDKTETKKRTILARFEIDDNDVIEQKLYDSLNCQALKDFSVLKDTSHYYDNDKTFRDLSKKASKAKKLLNDYTNKLKIK